MPSSEREPLSRREFGQQSLAFLQTHPRMLFSQPEVIAALGLPDQDPVRAWGYLQRVVLRGEVITVGEYGCAYWPEEKPPAGLQELGVSLYFDDDSSGKIIPGLSCLSKREVETAGISGLLPTFGQLGFSKKSIFRVALNGQPRGVLAYLAHRFGCFCPDEQIWLNCFLDSSRLEGADPFCFGEEEEASLAEALKKVRKAISSDWCPYQLYSPGQLRGHFLIREISPSQRGQVSLPVGERITTSFPVPGEADKTFEAVRALLEGVEVGTDDSSQPGILSLALNGEKRVFLALMMKFGQQPISSEKIQTEFKAFFGEGVRMSREKVFEQISGLNQAFIDWGINCRIYSSALNNVLRYWIRPAWEEGAIVEAPELLFQWEEALAKVPDEGVRSLTLGFLRQARVSAGERVTLVANRKEREVLCALAENWGKTTKYKDLLARCWPDKQMKETNFKVKAGSVPKVISLTVSNLRKKLREAEVPLAIRAVRNTGYFLEAT
ncbi:helix-turn-helix domain-containing protein [Patescibacteria group bacterium]